MGKLHLFTINACPGVPEPPPPPPEEVEPEVEVLEEVESSELLDGVGVEAAGDCAGATGAGAGAGCDHDGCCRGDGEATVARAKKPTITRALIVDPKERMTGCGLWGVEL